MLFVHTGGEEFRDLAMRVLRPMIPDLTERPINNLPAGNEIFNGLCLGAEITGSAELHDLAVKASKNLVATMWSDKQGRFLPWLNFDPHEIPLEWGGMIYHLLWTSHAVPEHLELFARHHENVLSAGLVREDGSTAHVAITDDDGTVKRYETLQGYSAESTWARGQSWALHNFMVGAEATERASLREAARRMTRWWLDHIPSDWVPFYDFNDPERDLRPRDPCAAAMATSALMRLNGNPETASDELSTVIDSTITELCHNYVSAGGVVIHGSLGNVPPTFYGGQTSRLPPGHGDANVIRARFPQEEIMPYGNYFLAEILHRRLRGETYFPQYISSRKFV